MKKSIFRISIFASSILLLTHLIISSSVWSMDINLPEVSRKRGEVKVEQVSKYCKNVSAGKLLHKYVEKEELSEIETILNKGCDVNEADSEGRTPLHFAAYRGNIGIIKRLIDKGATLAAKNKLGHTPYDVINDDSASWVEVKILLGGSPASIDLEKKARLEALIIEIAKNPDKYCVIYQAGDGSLFGIQYCIESLQNDVNVQSDEGETALHWAAKAGHLEAVKYLIKLGADLQLKTKAGKTPLDYANENGHRDVDSIESVAGYLSGKLPKKPFLKSKYLPTELWHADFIETHFDKNMGESEKFKKIVTRLGRVPGAIENIRKVVEHKFRGFLYELEDALEMAENGIPIEAFGAKYPDESGTLLDFDIQTPTKLIENKSFCWDFIEENADIDELKASFIRHKNTAEKNGSRIWELHSKNKIPYEWEEWLSQNNISFVVTTSARDHSFLTLLSQHMKTFFLAIEIMSDSAGINASQ